MTLLDEPLKAFSQVIITRFLQAIIALFVLATINGQTKDLQKTDTLVLVQNGVWLTGIFIVATVVTITITNATAFPQRKRSTLSRPNKVRLQRVENLIATFFTWALITGRPDWSQLVGLVGLILLFILYMTVEPSTSEKNRRRKLEQVKDC